MDDDVRLKFRSYEPQSESLSGYVNKAQPEDIQSLIIDKLELLGQNTNRVEFKKIDWDLKRRIEKRMEKLDRETKKSIKNLIKNNK